MDKKRIEELAKGPRCIADIYNSCDRWCEWCAFTSRRGPAVSTFVPLETAILQCLDGDPKW